MNDLNLHHLRYFWAVAREGSISGAAGSLGVTAPTVSTQVAALERELGVVLFRRRGNRLEITPRGRMVQRYASDIFALSRDLLEAVKEGEGGEGGKAPTRLSVGISDSLPLLSAHHLLAPVLAVPPAQQRLTLRVDKVPALLGGLSARTLDVVLAETPTGPTAPGRPGGRWAPPGSIG